MVREQRSKWKIWMNTFENNEGTNKSKRTTFNWHLNAGNGAQSLGFTTLIEDNEKITSAWLWSYSMESSPLFYFSMIMWWVWAGAFKYTQTEIFMQAHSFDRLLKTQNGAFCAYWNDQMWYKAIVTIRTCAKSGIVKKDNYIHFKWILLSHKNSAHRSMVQIQQSVRTDSKSPINDQM